MAKSEQNNLSYLSKILRSLSKEFGAELVLEPNFGRAGYIEFNSGKRYFFKGTSFDINSLGASQICKDKDYCSRFLQMSGLNTPEGKIVFSPKFIRAIELKNRQQASRLNSYADALAAVEIFGFPLFVKPNDGSEGDGVKQVRTVEELILHLNDLFIYYDHVLVQRPVSGTDYRLVLIDGDVISAYARLPLSVIGDGTNSIEYILSSQVKLLNAQGRTLGIMLSDDRIITYLSAQNLNISSVIAEGQRVQLLPNANLSTGGQAVDVMDSIDNAYIDICRRAAKAVGLRLAGVDIICQDISTYDDGYVVLEVNSAPGLNNFGSSGYRENDSVIDLYRLLFQKLMQDSMR